MIDLYLHTSVRFAETRQVPVIAPLTSSKTIPDSLEITKYLGKYYPSLIPDSERDKITQLLEELHSINFFALTFTGRPQVQRPNEIFLQTQLEGQISQKYRDAIHLKLER